MPDTTPDINVTTVFLLLGELKAQVGELKEQTKDGFTGVNARLDTLNGRVGKSETRVAVLEERTPGTARAGWWGAGMGTAVVAVLEVGKAVVSAWTK